MVAEIENSDLTIFLSFNGHVWKEQQILANKIAEIIPENKFVVAGLRNPQDVMQEEAYKKHLVYLTYSPSSASLKTFFDALENYSIPTGTLPMKS